ncbi:MAG: heme biosynthesis HemY N-terminal domain-containing protein [Porticoccaceae bacterium]|nr:heme biosynthesis HemY N-terminal domain-containing protein [Porticoccaceae bacterium]MDG1474439.1 heme biosynthesis HemY N-terminal domain-containing protein [Porticoccaceae bacterium]
MRRFLVLVVGSLLLGASSLWFLQQESGYILFSFNQTTVEMTIWVGLSLYLISTSVIIWLFLTGKWLLAAGGFKQWWMRRNSQRYVNQTMHGLVLFADEDWQKATDILADSALKSNMPDVNLLFAAKAAAESHQLQKAEELLVRLKTDYPNANLLVDKTFAQMLVREGKYDQALDILQPLSIERPSDSGVLRLLVEIYHLTENWSKLQNLLSDVRRFQAINKIDLDTLELEVYVKLFQKFQLTAGFTDQEKRDQVGDLWELIPRKLRQNTDLLCAYFDALQQVNQQDKLADLLCKSIASQWNIELVRRLGETTTKIPEKYLMTVEKWIPHHPHDTILLTTAGNICCQLQFWGKAHSYFSSAMALQATPDLYLKLADVLTQMGDFMGSQAMCREGLLLANRKR